MSITSREIAACELPICYRARQHYSHLWQISNARDLCKQLLTLAAVPTITAAEYANIAIVADGGMWPVPDTIYTVQDWNADGTMQAVAGQEIDPEIYTHMLNVLPPLNLPRIERTQEYEAGFMVSEPDCFNPIGPGMLYAAYGMKDGRCHYIGLLPRR